MGEGGEYFGSLRSAHGQNEEDFAAQVPSAAGSCAAATAYSIKLSLEPYIAQNVAPVVDLGYEYACNRQPEKK